MTLFALLQYAVFLAIVTLLVRPVGVYLTRVFDGTRTPLDPLLVPVERGIYRLAGVDPRREMDWRSYALSFTQFTLLGAVLLYLILRLQEQLPWYDATYLTTPMTKALAMNTAVSFATTTTWQAYGGETTMSYASQMLGLAAQNFLAGAAGLAVGIAFIRGFARRTSGTMGNFWVDLTRAVLWVLLPAAILVSVALVGLGVPQTFKDYAIVAALPGGEQIIAWGPVAALESIKNLGTNGGGFFNVNAAHPFENPTPLANLLENLSIVVLPAALTYTFGRMIGRRRDGWLLYIIMVVLFSAGLLLAGWAEQDGNPRLDDTVQQAATSAQPGGNMEGKEARFGVGGSVLAAIATSNGATGSYNSMHDSYTPLGGAVPLVNMLLGELIFGGLGTGIYSIVMVAVLAMFLTGLMVGRTPEYLGKRIGPHEIKIVAVYILIGPAVILALAAIAVVTASGLAGLTTNQGPHGFSEIFYAYTSSFANNGQNFAGLSANTIFYNLMTALAMLAGRLGLAIPALAVAGLVARQPTRAATAGTLPSASLTFGLVLIGTIVIVGALTYLPPIVLGPVVEHFRLAQGD
jgi:K+-transporting ATPase ATPase A chain